MRKSGNKSKTSNEKKGFLLILSAPSGCGKTTTLTRLLKRHPDWIRSVSVTTRPPRPEEEEGRDYEFVSRQRFLALKRNREFSEWAKVFQHYYGTRKKTVEEGIQEGRTVVLTVDIQGNRSIRRTLGRKIPYYSIFILPPSVQALRERLEKRSTDSPEEIERRIQMAEEEIKAAREYHATVINHDLDQTTHEIEEGVSEFKKKLKLKGEVKYGVYSTRKVSA